MKTLENFLRDSKKFHNEKLKENFPFNERELAKAELVRSLLKMVDEGKLIN